MSTVRRRVEDRNRKYAVCRTDYLKRDGKTYISHPLLLWSPECENPVAAYSNIVYMVERFDDIHIEQPPERGIKLWVLGTSDMQELLEQLDVMPTFEGVGVEGMADTLMDWEDDAWEHHGRAGLLLYLDGERHRELLGRFPREQEQLAWDAFIQAKKDIDLQLVRIIKGVRQPVLSKRYPIMWNGVRIPVAILGKHFAARLGEMLDDTA